MLHIHWNALLIHVMSTTDNARYFKGINWCLGGLNTVFSNEKTAVNASASVGRDILFGWESQVAELIETICSGVEKAKGLVMKVSNVDSCVWYGVAFLRGHGGIFQSSQEMRALLMCLLVGRDEERFKSSPSHQI